jgi:hypothetical protein
MGDKHIERGGRFGAAVGRIPAGPMRISAGRISPERLSAGRISPERVSAERISPERLSGSWLSAERADCLTRWQRWSAFPRKPQLV